MARITKPPKFETLEISKIWEAILLEEQDNLIDYIKLNEKEDYNPFDKFQYTIPSHLNKELAWKLIKANRFNKRITLFPFGDEGIVGSFVLTTKIQQTLSITDQKTTEAVLQYMMKNIGEDPYLKCLLKDLCEDEAISSSQLEGAATTTLDAKRLLKNERKAKTIDEKMIIGNYKLMNYAWENKNEKLSIELIKNLHKIGVETINDKKYSPGEFRVNEDKVVIADYDGDVIHYPPDANKIEDRLKLIIDWVNVSHNENLDKSYIHPLIKAIILHFCIGYEHPFKDGNGRVARALFYWFMFKHNYSAFRYIAISKLLKKASVQYAKAYIYTETDNIDLTYFIENQCKIVIKGITNFMQIYPNLP